MDSFTENVIVVIELNGFGYGENNEKSKGINSLSADRSIGYVVENLICLPERRSTQTA